MNPHINPLKLGHVDPTHTHNLSRCHLEKIGREDRTMTRVNQKAQFPITGHEAIEFVAMARVKHEW